MSSINSDSKVTKGTATDIFGQEWIIRRRVDSGHGFDLLYGVAPEDGQRGGPNHTIMNEALRGFILNNLKEFPYLDLPITPKHRARLRRMVSSLRFASLDEWQTTKQIDANPFYVHPDYIELPALTDIDGQSFEPSMITRAENGLLLWTGIPEKTTANQARGARQAQYVLTPELANWLDGHKTLTLAQMETILAPMSRPLIARFMRRLTARQAPNLQAWKEAKAPSSYMHHNYIKDGIITDALGQRYAIVSITHAPNGLMLLHGRPENATHKNGQEIIITPELAALIENHPTKGGYTQLRTLTGLSYDTLRRIRDTLHLKPMRSDCKIPNEMNTD